MNTLPYSSKGNLVETFHRYLLYAIEVNIQLCCIQITDIKYFHFSITSLNNISYYKIKTLTPQNITGICANFNPTLGILNLSSLKEQGYEPYTIQLSNSQYVNNLLTQLRLEKMEDNEEINAKIETKVTNLFSLVLITTRTSTYSKII